MSITSSEGRDVQGQHAQENTAGALEMDSATQLKIDTAIRLADLGINGPCFESNRARSKMNVDSKVN